MTIKTMTFRTAVQAALSMPIKTMTFRTAVQAALFQNEIKGQLSDGFWENYGGESWIPWCGAEVAVGQPGRNFPARACYNLANKDLIDCIGPRMIEIAKAAGAPDSYGLRELRADLREMTRAMQVSHG